MLWVCTKKGLAKCQNTANQRNCHHSQSYQWIQNHYYCCQCKTAQSSSQDINAQFHDNISSHHGTCDQQDMVVCLFQMDLTRQGFHYFASDISMNSTRRLEVNHVQEVAKMSCKIQGENDDSSKNSHKSRAQDENQGNVSNEDSSKSQKASLSPRV